MQQSAAGSDNAGMGFDLIRLFFDPLCPACARPVRSGGVFCTQCAGAQETLAPPYCRSCGIPVSREGFCGSCLQEPLPFAAAFSALPYGGPVAHAVRRGKYGPVPWVFGRLGHLLVPLLQAAGPGWVVPVPSTPSAWRKRGFSPVLQLCRSACRELDARNWPLSPVLQRRDGRPAQAFLHGEERRHLSASEFTLQRSVEGKRVLLVDDVMTTGATARAAARCLRDAAEIVVITLCRTL